MANIENNDATRLYEERFFEYDFEKEEFPGKDDMEAMDSLSTFKEYVIKYAKKSGFTDETDDVKSLVKFLGVRCKDAEVSISRQTLENWLSNGLLANTASARENVYRLCFALGMNAVETKEFFLKAYLERPFNYKDINEAVYFFCMNNKLTYMDATRIIATINDTPVVENPDADDITEVIGEELSKINTEELFLKYITENRYGFSVKNKTAIERIEALVESSMVLASKEYAITNSHYEDIVVDKIDTLLNVIYGYSACAEEDKKAVYKKSISDSNFPKLIKRNWPQKEQFKNILKKKNASYDVIRRALIILSFYDFVANAINEKALGNGIFDELTDEINLVLSECGYVQLYWRNPFDWMIGYCAMARNPLDTFRDLIEEYYLNDPTVFAQVEE